ncbi:MAG TPA: hypothetical protein PLY19_12720 [Rhodoglobus sp.]|mgnify:CR=1 FL=1|nr:hypothetical protein [Rhodoglobus sp.]
MDYTVVDVIGHALPLAVGVALSPFPLISVVLLLMSPQGRAAGATFLVGRILGLAVMLGHRYGIWDTSVPLKPIADAAFDMIAVGLERRDER